MNLNYLFGVLCFIVWIVALVDCIQSNNSNKLLLGGRHHFAAVSGHDPLFCARKIAGLTPGIAAALAPASAGRPFSLPFASGQHCVMATHGI